MTMAFLFSVTLFCFTLSCFIWLYLVYILYDTFLYYKTLSCFLCRCLPFYAPLTIRMWQERPCPPHMNFLQWFHGEELVFLAGVHPRTRGHSVPTLCSLQQNTHSNFIHHRHQRVKITLYTGLGFHIVLPWVGRLKLAFLDQVPCELHG